MRAARLNPPIARDFDIRQAAVDGTIDPDSRRSLGLPGRAHPAIFGFSKTTVTGFRIHCARKFDHSPGLPFRPGRTLDEGRVT